MKNFNIPETQLTSNLRELINAREAGCYMVYGVFIYDNALSINKLHKGAFADITYSAAQVEEPTTPHAALGYYLVPVPEFMVAETDVEYAKYIQLHFIAEADMKSDEEMMQEFVKAFAAKLAGTEESDSSEAETTESGRTNVWTEVPLDTPTLEEALNIPHVTEEELQLVSQELDDNSGVLA